MATSLWLFYFSCFFFCITSFNATAQNHHFGAALHTETQPSYTPWKNNYQLTKITYYKERVVIELRFEFDQQKNQWTESVAFMPPNNLNAWCLKNVKDSISKNLSFFKELSGEEIFNQRKNKFLKIGRGKGFVQSSDNLNSLSLNNNRFEKFKLQIKENNKKIILASLLFLVATFLIFFLS